MHKPTSPSNMHQGCNFQNDSNLPEMIHFYNARKSGVDLLDQMWGQYSCNKKPRRWPLWNFYRILNSAGVNSNIIYKDNINSANLSPQSRLSFLFSLAEDFMRPWVKERMKNICIQRKLGVLQLANRVSWSQHPTSSGV